MAMVFEGLFQVMSINRKVFNKKIKKIPSSDKTLFNPIRSAKNVHFENQIKFHNDHRLMWTQCYIIILYLHVEFPVEIFFGKRNICAYIYLNTETENDNSW